MKSRPCVTALAALCLVSCAAPVTSDPSSYYYASSNPPAAPKRSTTPTTTSRATPVPRGGYAPGSGPTSMPTTNQFMYQQRVSGPFGSRSSTGVIQSSGPIESYQTIGGVPVYPGASLPGYNPNNPYGFGAPQPMFVPGVGGNPGYYVHPGTGARMRVGP